VIFGHNGLLGSTEGLLSSDDAGMAEEMRKAESEGERYKEEKKKKTDGTVKEKEKKDGTVKEKKKKKEGGKGRLRDGQEG